MALGSLWEKDPEAPAREGRSLGAGPIVENSSFSQLGSPPTGQTQSSFKKRSYSPRTKSACKSQEGAKSPTSPHGALGTTWAQVLGSVCVVALVGVRGVDTAGE